MVDTGPDIYARMGVRAVINAQGNRTLLGGSATVPEVTEVMQTVNNTYVAMRELLERSGEYIADMLGVEAAYVTSGASAALALSAAACMTGRDPDRIAQLPDTSGMKNEIIIQKAQRYAYDRSYTVPGAKLIEAGDEHGCSEKQLKHVIGPDTAAIAYFITPDNTDSMLSLEQVVEVGRAVGLPTIADAAAQIYPLDYFRKNAQSADLVCFGAKYLGASQSSGFVCGNKELVQAASDHGFIAFQHNNGRSFGRPMKLDKQEIVGVVTAIERWLTMNHEDRLLEYEERLSTIEQKLKSLPGVSTAIEHVPQYFGATLNVSFDVEALGKTALDIYKYLDAGNPRVWVMVVDDRTITVNAHALNEGEDLIVAERIRMAVDA